MMPFRSFCKSRYHFPKTTFTSRTTLEKLPKSVRISFAHSLRGQQWGPDAVAYKSRPAMFLMLTCEIIGWLTCPHKPSSETLTGFKRAYGNTRHVQHHSGLLKLHSSHL